MAVTFSWNGYIDTDLDFSEFFNNEHTLVLRFMPQYPNAYEGPLVAENGSGTFVLGQGYFSNGPDKPGSTKLYLAVAEQSEAYAVGLTAGKWYHLALVVKNSGNQRIFTLYLDGVKAGTSLSVAASSSKMPKGKLRFGKRTSGKTVKGRNTQFYGILDDVAIFTKAFSLPEVLKLRDEVLQLTGKESGLLAGYTFATLTLAPKLKRPITFHGAAERVSTSANRNGAADAAKLPLPTQHQPMDLPFPPGEEWYVIQSVDNALGSHQSYAACRHYGAEAGSDW